MTLRWFLADLRTGRISRDLPVQSGRWQRRLNRPETVSCVLDMRDPDVIGLLLRGSAAPGKTVLAVAEGDVILAAGPIWPPQYDRDAKTMSLSATGVWSYFDHRYVMPVTAATADLYQFSIQDPADPDSKSLIPNPAYATTFTDWELGTIAKKVVQQSRDWTGGDLPITFEADRAGVHQRTWNAVEFKTVGEALKQLSEVEGGPDIRFMPRYTSDRLGIEWELQTGTDALPLLASVRTYQWDLTAYESAASGLQISQNASDLAGLAWATAGRLSTESLLSRATDNTLTNAGYALFETMDASHSTVTDHNTLDAYAAELARAGRTPVEVWSFTAEANMQPLLGSYWEGDFIELDVAPYDATSGQGDPYLYEGGTFEHRIVSISGDAKGETVDIECAPKVSG